MSKVDVSVGGGAVLVLVGMAALGVAGLYAWKNGGKIKEAVNPLSTNNLAYKGVNGVGAAITGNENWSLGGAIYDAIHSDPLGMPTFRPNLTQVVTDTGAIEQYDIMGNQIS